MALFLPEQLDVSTRQGRDQARGLLCNIDPAIAGAWYDPAKHEGETADGVRAVNAKVASAAKRVAELLPNDVPPPADDELKDLARRNLAAFAAMSDPALQVQEPPPITRDELQVLQFFIEHARWELVNVAARTPQGTEDAADAPSAAGQMAAVIGALEGSIDSLQKQAKCPDYLKIIKSSEAVSK